MLAVVAAFKEEVGSYLAEGEFRVELQENSLRFHRSRARPGIVVVEGGVGKRGALEAARKVIEQCRPDVVISAGFAGGVRAGMSPGDLFICDKLMSVEGPAPFWTNDTAKERCCADPGLLKTIAHLERTNREYAFGGCLSVPQFMSSSSIKAWIGATFPVSMIDMESFWVGEAAEEAGVPHIAVRAVLDSVDQTLPVFVGNTVSGDGRLRWISAVRYIVRRPTESIQLIRLRSQMKTAQTSLCEFLNTLSDT